MSLHISRATDIPKLWMRSRLVRWNPASFWPGITTKTSFVDRCFATVHRLDSARKAIQCPAICYVISWGLTNYRMIWSATISTRLSTIGKHDAKMYDIWDLVSVCCWYRMCVWLVSSCCPMRYEIDDHISLSRPSRTYHSKANLGLYSVGQLSRISNLHSSCDRNPFSLSHGRDFHVLNQGCMGSVIDRDSSPAEGSFYPWINRPYSVRLYESPILKKIEDISRIYRTAVNEAEEG